MLYNRDTMKGPIFPVNTDTQALDDDLLVIWYTMKDNIAWPSISRTYKCVWPTPSKRIVIASQLGSDGKNDQGVDQTWPDNNNIQVNYYDPIRYKELTVYFQNDPILGGYNPNEEHALIAPSFKYADAMPRPQAVFSLRNDLNISSGDHFTSMPMVLIHYYDTRLNQYKMEVFDIQTTDVNYGYTFDYTMKAGDILVAPYPVNRVIGVATPNEIFGKDTDPTHKCYWEDHKGQAWAISGDTDTEPEFYAYFWYPLDATFWFNIDEDNDGKIEGPAEPVPWLPGKTIGSGEGFPSDLVNKRLAVQVRFNVRWPEETPVLKAGETLTFPGGEYRADNPTSKGLPGVLGWAAGQVVFDSMNPDMNNLEVFSKYLVRLAPVLEQRTVPLLKDDLPSELQPASGNVNVVKGIYYFKELHSGLRNRIYYDPLNQEIGIRGFVNDKTLGDNDLMATPPSVYVLQPNIMSIQERDSIKDLAPTGTRFNSAVEELYDLSRKPTNIDDKDYTIGLQHYHDIDGNVDKFHGEPLMALGPGLALMPNSALLDPLDNDFASFTEGYITLAENNHESLGDLPVALHVIKVTKELYRGAIKTIFSENVFDEKIVLRHTADFGANTEDLVFVWYYREEDGTEEAPPNPPASMGKWKQLEGGLEYNLAGAGSALLVDNLFFCRYHHKNIGANQQIIWSDWAGAANSRPPQSGEDPAETYQPQLAEGWVKRVINGINPFEARVQDFSNIDSPATYVSMIQQAGQRYEGNVAFNPQKDVIENFGLIELYQTVLNRAMNLSIDLDNVANSSGVVTALLLATSRINGFYCLLGNEAYTDALDPTIGFGSNDVSYGSLLPTIFAFQNQVPNLLDEELKLLRGRDEEGARPAYNRLLWNFTKGEGEAAYAMSYNIQDVNSDGFIDEADGRALYPQGHGDAWGHYLTSLKVYYDLLTHKYFNWEARSEKFQIEGVVIDVDYFDERKFAESAASKAKVGCEVVHMTYRSKYVENPDGQWQGYKDTNNNQSWGVQGWGRKAALGAYFDWATANFILPSKDNDPTHTGVKKVDRSTVPDLVEIASQARSIQQTIDNADSGLNPLGLSTDAVPFDIDSTRLKPGVSSSTHFEQIAERAKKALENAQTIFDYANDLKMRLRQVSISTQNFSEQVMDQDRDYRNQLIEIFGTPYQGTIGSGKIYPAGYSGPDYFTYMYIDVNEVNDESIPPPNDTMKAYFQPMNEQFVETVDTSGFWSSAISGIGASNDSVDSIPAAFNHFFNTDLELSNYTTFDVSGVLEIEFPMSASSYSFQAPEKWGMRTSPGEIQIALTELIKAETDLKLELNDYAGLMSDIQTKVDLLKAFSDKNAEELKIGDQWAQKTIMFNTALAGLSLLQTTMEEAAETSEETSEIAAEAMPKVTGLSNDATSAARASTKLSSSIGKKMAKATGYAAQFTTYLLEQEKEIAEMDKDTNIDKVNYNYEVQQMLKDIEGDMGNEASKRVSIFKAREHMSQVSEKYRALLGKGLRLLEERKAFNARVAAKTQGKRYMDMAFRINMNNALSKYHSAFDIAARYVYLSAKAYDYDTNLSDRDPASPKSFMSDIMKERTLGQIQNGSYVIGNGGLGDILAKMTVNYDALKGQMGFNNPQNETGRFSLRKELFRIKDDGNAENDRAWRDILTSSVKGDLWAVPEFRKYCRPFIAEDVGFQPGIVLTFASNILSGKNFFGKKLGGGDHAYDSTNFATKVRSVGMWFDGYDNANLSETPRCYIVPTGSDIMLVPDSMELDSREWTIVDQKIPIPLPISNSDLNNPGWIPSLDGLNGSMIKIRRFSSFRAYHDNGYFDDSQISYDSRLVGRSVWNTKWLIIIPGATFHYDKHYGLKTFIETVKDIKLFFQTYAISGN
ncbi:MAG: PA14 domain protein [Candidatus Magnetoglobus multicellularis str. Araruama]|uniref:PA14 domain protein n=1 Tax=Candidatus Magnetoglobus multicellularis str. Araruama TaxID=890399 RepID=A0A1V1P8Z3_9BACT|nr:MAG: PA14 domain protein [Candidatus Magnetoglobus multicellularis str. Araruama]